MADPPPGPDLPVVLPDPPEVPPPGPGPSLAGFGGGAARVGEVGVCGAAAPGGVVAPEPVMPPCAIAGPAMKVAASVSAIGRVMVRMVGSSDGSHRLSP